MAWFDRCHDCDHARDFHIEGRCLVPGCECAGFVRHTRHAVFVPGGGYRRIEPRPPRLPRDTGG